MKNMRWNRLSAAPTNWPRPSSLRHNTLFKVGYTSSTLPWFALPQILAELKHPKRREMYAAQGAPLGGAVGVVPFAVGPLIDQVEIVIGDV